MSKFESLPIEERDAIIKALSKNLDALGFKRMSEEILKETSIDNLKKYVRIISIEIGKKNIATHDFFSNMKVLGLM